MTTLYTISSVGPKYSDLNVVENTIFFFSFSLYEEKNHGLSIRRILIQGCTPMYLISLCFRSLQGICLYEVSAIEKPQNMLCNLYWCATLIEKPFYQVNMERILNIVEANVYKDSRQHVILYKINGSHKDALPISTLLQFPLVSLFLSLSISICLSVSIKMSYFIR